MTERGSQVSHRDWHAAIWREYLWSQLRTRHEAGGSVEVCGPVAGSCDNSAIVLEVAGVFEGQRDQAADPCRDEVVGIILVYDASRPDGF